MYIIVYLEDEVYVKYLDWYNDYLYWIYLFWLIIIGWIVVDWKYFGINLF